MGAFVGQLFLQSTELRADFGLKAGELKGRMTQKEVADLCREATESDDKFGEWWCALAETQPHLLTRLLDSVCNLAAL